MNENYADNDLVYADFIHPVPEHVRPAPAHHWLVTVNARTGAVSADYTGPDDDHVWSTIHPGTNHPDGPAPITGAAQDLAQQVIKDRSTDRNFSNQLALSIALPETEATAANCLRDPNPDMAHATTTEALDRAYNRARMTLAGININSDELTHLRLYNHFYQLGFSPPTHQQMADHIIRSLRPNTARRLLNTLTHAVQNIGRMLPNFNGRTYHLIPSIPTNNACPTQPLTVQHFT